MDGATKVLTLFRFHEYYNLSLASQEMKEHFLQHQPREISHNSFDALTSLVKECLHSNSPSDQQDALKNFVQGSTRIYLNALSYATLFLHAKQLVEFVEVGQFVLQAKLTANMFLALPDCLLSKIFSHFAPSTLLRLRLVCRTFKKLVGDHPLRLNKRLRSLEDMERASRFSESWSWALPGPAVAGQFVLPPVDVARMKRIKLCLREVDIVRYARTLLAWIDGPACSDTAVFAEIEPFCNASDVLNFTVDDNRAEKPTVLCLAADSGQALKVARLLRHGASVNQQTKSGHTALMYAALNGHHSCAKLLLKAGSDVNLKDANGVSSLLLAVGNNDHELISLLLEHGADPNTQATSAGQTSALMAAAVHKDCVAVSLLLAAGARCDLNDEDGCTALSVAVSDGSVKATAQLLDAGSDPNSVDEDGTTCLMLACEIGDVDKLQLLLKHNANVHLTNSNGETAIMIAAKNGHLGCVAVLVESCPSQVVEAAVTLTHTTSPS